jgi:CheY-like chemotaxis protein
VIGDAESAWETLKDGAAVELILLDRRLPGMDGLTLLKRIKADADLRHVPVVMQTGLDAEEHIREGLAAGAYYCPTKPRQSVLLLGVIRAALEQQRETALLQDALSEAVHALGFLQSGTFSFRTITEARSLAQSLAKLCPDPSRAVLGLQELMIVSVPRHLASAAGLDRVDDLFGDLWWKFPLTNLTVRFRNPNLRLPSVVKHP